MTGTEANAHWWLLIVAYLLGSVPFGFLIAKARQGRDIRSAGSGNIGAANVARVVGPGAGALTFLLDAAKGYLAVWLVARFAGEGAAWAILAALAAIVGHVFPVWLGFRGGRGVATGLGAFLLICWPAVLAALVIWLAVVLFWRYVSLGSIVAAASLPLLVYLLYDLKYAPPRAVSIGTLVTALIVIAKHRPNIQRLVAGTEPRFTFRR